eukprot:2538033-Amphidinium_carterae.1
MESLARTYACSVAPSMWDLHCGHIEREVIVHSLHFGCQLPDNSSRIQPVSRDYLRKVANDSKVPRN